MAVDHVYPPAMTKDRYIFKKMPVPRHDQDHITPSIGMVLLQRDTDTPGGASDGTLVLPRSASEDAAYYGAARVLAVGELMKDHKGIPVDFGLKVGQVVLYEQHSCQAVRFDLARDRKTILLEQHYVKLALEDVEIVEID